MAAVLNFLNVDAQIPLTEGGEVDHTKSEGFKKATVALSPAFSSAVTDYAVDVPAGTTHVNVMATSFSGAAIKIANTPGNMNCVDIRGGVASIAITLELDGAVAATYTLRPNVTAAQAADARVVMHEKPPVEADDAAPHAHTHNGVACTTDHSKDESHGHGHGEKKDHSHGHGHSHDGGKTECTADHSKEEGHGHGHGEKKKEHSHGHGHSHDGGKTECHEDHGHGHGHGEEKKKEHSHGHGHSH